MAKWFDINLHYYNIACTYMYRVRVVELARENLAIITKSLKFVPVSIKYLLFYPCRWTK